MNVTAIVKKLSIVTVILIIAFFAVMLKDFIFSSENFFYIQQFEIHGERYLTHRDLIALSKLNVGDKLFDQNLRQIEENIHRSPYIKHVKVERRIPSTVLIIVEEEIPIAYLQTQNTKLISENGVILPRAIDYDYPDLPVINFSDYEATQDGMKISQAEIQKMIDVLIEIKRVSVDLSSIISEIKTIDGQVKILLVKGSAELLFDVENMRKQFENLSIYLYKTNNINFLNKAKYIDIRYEDKVIIKDRGKGS